MAQLESDRWAGAVLLGDRLLAPKIHHVLRAWLGRHPHVEVRAGPWHALPPAPAGMRAACTGEALDVPTRASTAGALARGLFASPTAGVPMDDTVVLARTPDDVREVAEAVRTALDAVRDGVPLDRIAIVVPDAEQIGVLRAHLERAGVPATWLVGPPIATTPAARFLVHALEVAHGDDTVPAWYGLLRQPELQLRSAVAADVTEGRGRWRKVLAGCGAVRDTRVIVSAIQSWADALDASAFDPRRGPPLGQQSHPRHPRASLGTRHGTGPSAGQ